MQVAAGTEHIVVDDYEPVAQQEGLAVGQRVLEAHRVRRPAGGCREGELDAGRVARRHLVGEAEAIDQPEPEVVATLRRVDLDDRPVAERAVHDPEDGEVVLSAVGAERVGPSVQVLRPREAALRERLGLCLIALRLAGLELTLELLHAVRVVHADAGEICHPLVDRLESVHPDEDREEGHPDNRADQRPEDEREVVRVMFEPRGDAEPDERSEEQ